MSTLTPVEFERVLDRAAGILTENLRSSNLYRNQANFEQHVRDMLKVAGDNLGVDVAAGLHPHAFPDIRVNGFGVEVKYTEKDTWRAVGNSVFEGMRDPDVRRIYVMYGKAGGEPEVRWRRYEDCIAHVRVSHSPRFVVEMEENAPSLFAQLGVGYDDFCQLGLEDKMRHIREYARGRLQKGERLWWLEDVEDPTHSLPMQVRLYMRLSQDEKRALRAEAALLCPQICKGSRKRGKYTDAALYLLTHHGVFCPQTRDLFSAGSVAMRESKERGGNYILRALRDIEDQMRVVARTLDGRLFTEYWGEDCSPEKRIEEWLRRADQYATGWRPSSHLFKKSESEQEK